MFIMGQAVRAVFTAPMTGNDVAPPLIQGREYLIKDIFHDSAGNQHLHVGLVSKFNFIRSFETKEHLPDGDKIHWCHPSRFEKIVHNMELEQA